MVILAGGSGEVDGGWSRGFREVIRNRVLFRSSMTINFVQKRSRKHEVRARCEYTRCIQSNEWMFGRSLKANKALV